jgi:hypothetical protein
MAELPLAGGRVECSLFVLSESRGLFDGAQPVLVPRGIADAARPWRSQSMVPIGAMEICMEICAMKRHEKWAHR